MDLTLQRYEIALTNQAYGIVLVSEEGGIEFVNQRFCEIFGLDLHPNDLVGLKTAEFLRIIAPAYADPTGTLDLIMGTVVANVQQVGDHVLMRDGRTILVDYTPIMLDGKSRGRMWQIRDITEVRQAQEALRQSEEKFSTAFQISPYAISITRMEDGGILEVNDAFVSILGYSREELVDQTTASIGLLVDKTDRDSVVSALRHGQVVAGRELRLRKKNGEIITGLLSAQAVDLSQGRCIMSSVDDITARKQAALELQSKRRLLSDLIERSGALICVKDREGRYELVNKRWETVTGISREDVIGKTDADLFPGPIAEQFRSNDLEAIETQAEVEKEEYLEDESGKRFFISIKFPVYEDDGTVHGLCAIITEITSRKEAEDKVQYLATHDGLTGLPNLGLAKDRLTMALSTARRQNKMVGVMFIDLDGFKTVNDTLGHEVGDLVLQETAQRTLSCVRETDTVARVGGDEFLVVATGLQADEDAALIAEKLVRRIAEPVILGDGLQTSVGASVGVALCRVCGQDADRMIKAADTAMYKIKNAGKNGYRFAEAADSQ